MKEVTLVRDCYGEGSVEGSLVIMGDLIEGTNQRVKHVFYSLELPWKDNESSVSCIPEGSYTCEMRESPKFGWRYILRGTYPRTYILIHPGNYPRNTYGCLLLGMSRGESDGLPAIWNSQVAVTDFENLMDKEPFQLTITSEWSSRELTGV